MTSRLGRLSRLLLLIVVGAALAFAFLWVQFELGFGGVASRAWWVPQDAAAATNAGSVDALLAAGQASSRIARFLTLPIALLLTGALAGWFIGKLQILDAIVVSLPLALFAGNLSVTRSALLLALYAAIILLASHILTLIGPGRRAP
jgi:hypothetical protein